MAENKKPMSFDEWANAGGGAVKPVETGLAGRAGDLGLSLLKGAIAVPEAAVGAADIVTGGKAGKKAEELGFRPKEAKAYLDSLKSDAAKDAQYKFENADGFTGKFGAAVQNPSLIANAIAESVPLMGAGGVVGRGLIAAATPRAVAGAAQAAPRISGAVASAAGEGITGAGSAAEGIRQETANGELTGTQSLLAAGSGVATGLLGLGGAKAAKALGVGDIDQAIVGGTTKVAGQAGKEAPDMLSSMGRGALSEGVFEELPQSLSEQAIQNVALDKPWTQELDAAAAMGLLTGGAMGGGMGLLGRQQPDAHPPTVPQGTPPVAPPMLGLPPPVITVSADGNAMTAGDRNNRFQNAGDITDVTPIREQSFGQPPAAPTFTSTLNTDDVYTGWSNVRDGSDRQTMSDQMDYVGKVYAGKVTPETAGAWDKELSKQFKWYRAATPEARQAALETLIAPPAPPKPSEQMGLNPAAGPLSAAAVTAVDGDATPSMQAAAQATAQQEQAAQVQQQADDKRKSSGWTMNEYPVGDEPMVASLESKDAPLFMTQAGETFNVRDADWNVVATGNSFEEAAGRAKVQQASGGKAVQPTTGATDGATPAQTQQTGQKGQAESETDWSMGAKPLATPPGSGFQDSTAKRAQGLKSIRERNGLNKPVALIDEGKTDSAEQPGTTGEGAGVSQPKPLTLDARKRNLATLKQRMMAGRKDATQPAAAETEKPSKSGDVLFDQYGTDYRIEGESIGEVTLTKNPGKLSERTVKMDGATFERLRKEDAQFRKESRQAVAKQATDQGQEDELDAEMRAYEDGLTAQTRATDREQLAKQAEAEKPAGDNDVGQQWSRSTTVEREGLAARAGLSPIAAKNLSSRGWAALDPVVQESIEHGMAKATGEADATPSERVGTVSVPTSVDALLTQAMEAQKGRITRLRNLAKADGSTLEERKAANLKVIAAEATLRKMRTTRFDAEDAVAAAMKSGNAEDARSIEDLYPRAFAEVEALLAKADTPPDQSKARAQSQVLEQPAQDRYPAPSIKQQRSNDWPSASDGWQMVGGSREAPGSASEKSAKIELGKNPEWAARGAVILPFAYNDGGVFGLSKYGETSTRYAILVREEKYTPPEKPEASNFDQKTLVDKSYLFEKPGDVGIVVGNGRVRFVSMSDAIAAVREALGSGTRPTPFQIHNATGIRLGDVDGVLNAMKAEAVAPVRKTVESEQATDLDAMFDDVLAEEKAKDEAASQPVPKPTNLKQAIAQQRAKRANPKSAADKSVSVGDQLKWNGGFNAYVANDELLTITGFTPDGTHVHLSNGRQAEVAAIGKSWIKVQPQRTATQAATSAAKNTASALGNAIDGLGALFGGGGKLNSGLSFDAETYAKAKPLFQAAVANLGDAGRDMKEAMRAVVRMVMDKFGAQVAQNMKPYVVKFIQETNQENLDTTTSQADTGTKENNDERTQVRGNGPQALGGMAAQENGGTEGQRGTAERVPGSGTDGNEQGSGTGGAGDAADAGRSGSNPGGRAGTTRATGRGRLGGKGAGGDGGRVSGASTSGEENRPEVRGGVPEGGTGSEAPASIPAVNFRITPDLRLGQGGEVQKFKDNVAAIEVLKRIEAENRRATAAEQFILARYVGWGGLANAFPDPMSGEFKEKWKERGEALRELLTDTEYANARRSTQDAHYTSETVVSAMWGMARKLGFKGGLTLENSLGSGNFVGLVPEGLAAKFIGVEQDSLTARIAQALYPQATVLNSGLQDVPLSDNAFALNIGNPPFGSKPLRFQFKPELAGKSIHNQFFLSGLDALRPGGLQVMVVSRYLMDAQDKSSRLAMAKKAKLVGLFRLPDNAFRENARTDVVTDIVVFQKLTEAEQADMGFAVAAYSQGKQKGADAEAERAALAAKVPYWVETTQVADPLGGEPMTVNAYFKQNPGDVLGVLERSGSMQHGNDITVRLDDVAQLPGLLERATSRLPANIQSLSDEVMAATEARFKSMSDALRIALAKEEEGHLKIDADGKMQRVIERGTPEGDYELARQEITPDSPWSDQLRQDANGKWYRMEVVTGEDGKPVKQVNADGKATKFNVYKQVVFADDADIPESLRLGKTGFDRLVGIIKLRDLLKRQLELETADAPKLAMEGNRKKLAAAYDEFVAKHGPVNRSTNSRLADTMPDGGLVQALEVSYQPERSKEQAKRSGLEVQPEVAKPAPILKERVVPKYEPATKAASPADALAITLAETGRVDIDRIAQLLGVDGNEAADMLQSGDAPLAFNDPETSTWETANNYLSGMVKRKLNAAKQAGLEKNVTALEKVQPEAWTAENVTVQMGSTWVPPEVYADFIKHLTGGQARVRFSAVTNSFSVDAQGGAKAKDWSTGRASVGEIVTRMLNSQAVVVRDTDSDGSSRINQEETSLAGLKAREINSEFLDWVFQDSDRRSRLVEIFNDKFNTRVNRQYDGSHLMLPGKVPDTIIAMRRHQLNAIWRGIYERFMLVDHAVGAGKTYTAIARAMERRRMGLSQKPMIVVPNHLVEQWAADVYRLYPGAKVLAAGKKDFEAKRRRRVFGKVATGDWDIVIVPHSSFGFIGIAPETEARYLEQEMELAKQAIADAWEQAKEDGTDQGYRKPFGVKEAERLTDKIQARMDKLNSGAKDRLLTFEQLGVDDLTIDESHEFKNLYYSSRLTGVRGMGNKTGSKKANDLYNKVRVMRDSPTGSVAFLTGTPISNSAVEMFTVMRYLAADSLSEAGMEHFDSWRAQYVEATPAFEPTESGRLKEVTRLGRTWSNMRSLMDLYYQFTDAVSLDDIKKWFAEDNKGKQFPVPKVKGGKDRRLVPVPPTAAQDAELKAVMSDFDGLDDIEDTYERNATRLRLMDRARKLSLDIRAVNPRANSKEEGGKLEVVSKEVKRIYDQWSDDKGTQLIFLDRSVPKSKGDDAILKEYDALVAKRDAALRANDEEGIQDAMDSLEKFDSNEMAELRIAQAGGWNAYQQIKDNLVAMGIPAAEIRFIQEATNDEQKMAMFDAVNGGKVRVMIGSTPRMGAGTNVQQRVVALHHVDVTWKPSDIEQREGRAIRQGNKLLDKYGPDFEVEIMAYATERTVDAKMWDLNATKLRTINGIRNYDGAFSMEFEDEEAVGMAEMAALASGNPMLLERVKLESELNNLELLQKAHSRKMFGIRDARDAAKKAIERNPELISQARAVSDFITKRLDAVEARHAKRSVAVDGKEYFTQADALIAAENEIARQQEGNEKARYSINVNGKRVTSRSDLEDEISATLGDYEAFEAKIGNKTLKERTVAAREVAALVNPELVALPSDGAKNLEVGEMLGYKLVAELTRYIDRGNGMAEVSLTLFDADGKTVASETANRQPAMATFTTSMLRPSVEKLWAGVKRKASTANADYLEKQMQRAIQELPDLEERASAGFPKAQEIAEKRARLANVVSALSGNGQQTDDEAPAASRARPVFSRAAQGQASGVVQSIVDAITARWANAPKVVVAFDMNDPAIPERVRQEDQRQRSGGAEGTPEGFYYKGTVYLMSSKLANPRDVVRVLLHEALGHFGLRGVFGKELKPLLQQIATMRKSQIEAKMKEYGLRGVSSMDRLVAAEEVLAEMAQNAPTIGFVRRAVATIKAWLRKHIPGFGKMDLSDDEIITQFILPARNFVVNGGPSGGPGGGVQAPMFSRTVGEALNAGVNNVKAMQLPAGYMVNDLIQSHGKLDWWSKTVGTQYNLAQKSPAFKRVFDTAQGFLNDVSFYASEAANAAPTLLPKLETLKDLGKQAISAADNKAIAAPIFEGTLVWGRRDDGSLYRIDQSDEDTAPGVVFSDAELREQFNLTDDQISLYREFRAATDKSLLNMGLADMVRFGGEDLEGVADEVLAAENFGDALAIAGTQLRAVAQGEPKRAAVLLDTIAKMVEKVNKYQGLMDKGYAPLSRFGRHTLDVVDEDGARVYFGLFESEAEANKMARQMQANYPGAQVSQGTVSEEEHKLFAGVSPETVELFGEMLGLEGTGDEAADMAFQQYLKMAKANRSAMKRLIHRKGIAGFSEDPGRVLAGFVYSNARQTSSAVNMGELTQAVAAIPKGQGELKDHAVRLHNYVKNPIEEAQAFRGLLFAQYIGGSVASAIINTTQPFAVTMPWLSQFGGVSKAAKQMSAAVKDALKGSTGDAALDKALLKAAEDGIVSPQEVFQLQAQAAGRATLKAGDGTKVGDAMATASNALSKLGIAWGQLFGLAEQFNRRTTFIAAYRTAVEQGMNNPSAFAERAISETQFIYSKANKPRWARGAIGATLFTFKQYSISYVELMHRMATQGGPEGKKAALLGLAILFLLGGAGGLPFAEDVDDVIDGIMQRMGYNFSSKQAKQELFAGVLGEDGAKFMMRGVSGLAGVPVDVSGRFGMGNLIPATGLWTKKTDYTSDFMELAGPAGDMVKRAAQAGEKLARGEVMGAQGALATAAPLAGQNVVKAMEMANTGMYLDKKGRKVLDVDGYDAAMKVIGFQPNQIAAVQDATYDQQRMVGVNRMRESEIADKWARGLFLKDAEMVTQAREDLAQWNADNPMAPIQIKMPQVLRRVRDMNMSKAERVAKAAPQEVRARVREELSMR